MKKILIGTHNKGKFSEISYLISKRIKKVSPVKLKIKSPKETGRSFIANAKLKVKFFSKAGISFGFSFNFFLGYFSLFC